jgi:hypothetical protein
MAGVDVALVDASAAGEFWERSPQATAFTSPQVLSRLAHRVDWWMARKGAEPLCLWPVCRDEADTVRVPDFCYYVGPLWSHRISSIPAHSWLAETTEVHEALLSVLVARYGSIHAQLPLGQDDVRVFSWWNYHHPTEPRFEITPLYTATIGGLQERSEAEIHDSYRRLRRRQVRKASADGRFERSSMADAGEVARLYAEVMARQNAPVPPNTAGTVEALIDLAGHEGGYVVAFRERDGGELASVGLVLEARDVANFILCATVNRFRDTGLPALTVHNAIMEARARGAASFDFNGANSPNRGDDKHSYGAEARLFFDLRYPSPGRGQVG